MEEEQSDALSCEQEYLLRAIAQESMEMNKEELILALLGCWEARFRQKQVFLSTCKETRDYYKSLHETVTMSVDMNEIVLDLDN